MLWRYVWYLPFQSCLCAADSLNYPEERRQDGFRACAVYWGHTERLRLYSLCCCGVLWSSVTSCRPDLWLTLPGFSYTPCNDTVLQLEIHTHTHTQHPTTLLLLSAAYFQRELTCSAPTSSPLHTCLFHPLLELYHLERQHTRDTAYISEKNRSTISDFARHLDLISTVYDYQSTKVSN